MKATLLPLLALAACLACSATAGSDVLGPLPAPGWYGRLVEPSEYPAFDRRAFRVPTWKTFENRPQFVAGRHIPERDITAEQIAKLPDPDAVVPQHISLTFLGRVCRGDANLVLTPEPAFSDALRHVRDLGMYLFDLGGYGPGFPPGGYGQIKVTPVQTARMNDILGDRWLGFNLGEQDGRYHNGFVGRQLPSPRDWVGQHRIFCDWNDRIVDDLGGKVCLLTTLWGWHYPVQDGAVSLIGAECENRFGITAPQVQYAFLRGAGKQYGVLWYGDQSIFSTFGLSYWGIDQAGNLVPHPGGPSGNLLRRIFLNQLLWNSCILGFEGATVSADRGRTRGRPSPIGRVEIATEKLIRKGFTPGVMQTPVAILQDYFCGWMPPRTNCTQFTAFNALPYRPGDYLTDNLLALLFPGYEHSGFFFDENGAMCPTPYGDVADCLLADAPAEVLSRYNLVLCSGIETDLAGTRARLDAFLASGGIAMAVGDDAARLWPEYCRKETVAIPADTAVEWNGTVDRELREFALHEASLPASAEVLAKCQGRPLVARISRNGGTLILALCSTGMNRSPIKCAPSKSPMMGGGENTGLERPFRLLSHVQRACDAVLKAQRLFTAGDGLTVTSCRRADGVWVVGVSNPDLKSRPFAITSHIGEAASVREIDLGSSIHDLPGYWPHRWGPMRVDSKTKGGRTNREDLGEVTGEAAPSDQSHIGGGDMRFFEVTLKSCTARERPDLKLAAAPHDRILLVPDLATLRERLLAWPRFGAYFDGVLLDANAILDIDPGWLHEHSNWFKRHGLRVLVGAQGYSEGVTKAVVERLAAFGGGPELIVGNPSDLLRTAASKAGLTLVTPGRIRIFAAGKKIERSGDGIQVLVGDWRSWDALYQDIRAAWLDEVPGSIAGPGTPPTLQGKAASGKRRWISLHGIGDPIRAVEERPGLLGRFDGVVLESAWLEARSREALAKDRAFFEKAGLSVAIDFSRSINNFPDLTFANTVPHRHEASERIFDEVLAKMPALGAKRAIAVNHSIEYRDPSKKDQNDGIERFLNKAASLGIDIDWRTCAARPPRTIAAQAAWVADMKKRHPNLRIAACVADEPDANKLLAALAPAGKPELWLLAAPAPREGRFGVQFRPLTELPKAQVSAILTASKDATVVFDADYLDWREALADLDHSL